MLRGSKTLGTSAGSRASPSSSNNGAACRKNATAGNSTAAPGMKCRLPGTYCRSAMAQLRHVDNCVIHPPCADPIVAGRYHADYYAVLSQQAVLRREPIADQIALA